jgi:peptide/nickel transport system permease protein
MSTQDLTLRQTEVKIGGKNHFQLVMDYLIHNWSARIGFFILLAWLLLAIFAKQVSPQDPAKQNLYMRLAPPVWAEGSEKYDVSYLFGADQLGRDIFSRIIYGARISLLVGFASALISSVLGSIIGAIAGYFGGWLDEVLMSLTDLQMAFPAILLALAIMAVLGPGLLNIIIVFGITGWVQYARTLRSEILRIKEMEFIMAAKVIGVKNWRTILRNILPNALAPLIIVASFQVAQMITQEAALSFLGVGVPSGIPSWGNMLADGREYISSAWWLTTLPGLCLVSIVVGINFLGDVLRDAIDPLTVK